MNNVNLIGRISDDITYRITTDGQPAAYFRIAVKSMAYGGSIRTDHILCRAWDSVAEQMSESFKKGSRVAINGRIRTDHWEENGKKKYVTYVAARHVTATADLFGRADDADDNEE